MTILTETAARLTLALPVEIVRDKQRRLRVYKPNAAEYYELPGVSWDERLSLSVLPANRLVFGEHEVYRVEHIARRPRGDVDVVVSATLYDHRPHAYLAFRHCEGQWRPLVGRAQCLEDAVALAERERRFAGWESDDLVTVLATVGVR